MIQDAATAKAASDAVIIVDNPAINSLTISEIDAGITAASTRTDIRTYSETFVYYLEAGELIQTDKTKVLLSDVLTTLKDKGYRVSATPVNGRIKIQVAW